MKSKELPCYRSIQFKQYVISMGCYIRNFIFPVFFLIFSFELVNADDKAANSALAIGEAWAAHREAFQQFYCEYRLISTSATSRESALSSDFGDKYEANVVWVVDGNRERCSLKTDEGMEGVLSRVPDEASGTVSLLGFVPKDFLAFDGYMLFGGGELGIITLYTPDYPADYGNTIATPFSMGVMGQGHTHTWDWKIKTAFDMKLNFKTSIEKNEFGESVAVVKYSNKDGASSQIEFNPDKSMLFTKYLSLGRRRLECMVTKSQETKAGWFPMRCIRLVGESPNIEVRIIEVIKLRVGGTFNDNEFRIHLPANITVTDFANETETNLKQATSLTSNELPEFLEKIRKDQHLLNPGVNQNSNYSWILIVNITILGFFLLYTLYRKKIVNN